MKKLATHPGGIRCHSRLGTAVVGLALAVLGPPTAQAQVSPQVCGGLANGQNGPFDYRVERGHRLHVVEAYHFGPKVESLIAGNAGYLGADLDYVLRAFPNHHRALLAMARFSKLRKSATLPHVPRPAECYFERALRFKPDDNTARMLYASYLNDNQRSQEATTQLDMVILAAPDNAFTQYNVGMVFAEMGLHDRALAQAHLAQQMGFTRPELKQLLQAAGKWVDPPSAPAAAASSPASAVPAEPAASR